MPDDTRVYRVVPDLIAEASAVATNHGQFVKALNVLTNEWKKAGLISGSDKGAIVSCA